MTLVSEYTAHGLPRYSFGWENPNHAAAVLVSILPFLWLGRNRWCWPARIVEAVVSIAVAYTYSRGALVAWLGALVFFHTATGTMATQWRYIATRCGLMAAVVFCNGMIFRVRDVASGDPSSTNRIDLWGGGLKLIAANPWSGWGKGGSGLAYMHWIQAPATNASHLGMTNSFMHVAVEFGLPIFTIFCGITLIPAYICWRIARVAISPEVGFAALGAALTAFWVAAFFSTLWIVSSVAWVPLLLLCATGYFFHETPQSLSYLPGAAALCLVAGLLVGAAAWAVAAQGAWRLTATTSRLVRFDRGAAAGGILFLADGRVLGPYGGKLIRSAAEGEPHLSSFAISLPGDSSKQRFDYEHIFTFGARVQDIGQGGAGKKASAVVAIFPAGPPPPPLFDRRFRAVVLPEVDEIGSSVAWRRWAKETETPVFFVAGSGQDLRHGWKTTFAVLMNLIGQ